jgi:signal transduction histidine kinase
MTEARVLIVDDHREIAENLCEILSDLEDVVIHCHIAVDAQRAIEVAEKTDLDLAIVDLHLPDARGTDLIARLRQRSPFVQVVIITGDLAIEGAVMAVREGSFAYLLKPFQPPELMDTARRALEQCRLLREREELRVQLEQSERRHREVIEAVPAFVLGLDEAERVALWNRRLEETTGYSRDEMLGQPGSALVGAGGEVRRLPLKRGGHRLVRWQTAQVPAPRDGALTYALGVDVTDEHEMLRRTLRAERLAAVGTLAAGLAHEVRNPLNSALLQLEVLERRVERGERETSELLPVTEVVKQEIKRLERLVDDFLSFAQPRPLALEPIDLNDFVRAVLELVRPEAESRSVTVERELDPAAGIAELEPERFRQVLFNLFRNAFDAMPDGGTLTVRTRSADEHGNVLLDIEDTGVGLSEDAPVFDAFYTTKPTGTGLGLAIVHRIVTQHDGALQVRSKPGRTRFTITLPQKGSDAAQS